MAGGEDRHGLTARLAGGLRIPQQNRLYVEKRAKNAIKGSGDRVHARWQSFSCAASEFLLERSRPTA
jgi:hypothetical protein